MYWDVGAAACVEAVCASAEAGFVREIYGGDSGRCGEERDEM